MARILVVDDDADLVRFLTRVLQGQGWEVGAACDGEEALAQVKQGRWDAVLLDIRLPKVDGLTTLKLIRRHAPDLAVVVITGKAEQGDMIEAYRSGAYACMVKPLDEEEVVLTIENALGRPRPSRNWAAPAPTGAQGVSVDPDKKTEPLELD
jgi:DNA-binding response OmpR family regulator